MSNKEEIKNRMIALTEFVIEANNKILSGEMMDLSRLDQEVADLCDQTIALPPADAREIQPLMATMITRLEELGQSLKEFQTKLKETNNNN